MDELQPTLLVHEAYLRLVKASNVDLQGRTHFLGLAGRVMRQILVDEARRFNAGKRDRALQTRLTGDHENGEPAVHDIIELSELLDGLEQVDPLYVQIFEARAFAGMTFEECSETLEISVSSVKRKWKITLAWLKEQGLKEQPSS
jgi:RNA polymerase sigma factor (TIGR02999 family)